MSDIKKWDVEDPKFWESEGKKIANRNMWISIPSLLCGFAVWLYWGIITIQMLNLGFPFAKSELFTLMAIAGLTGATLRIPSSLFYSFSRWAKYHCIYHCFIDDTRYRCRYCFAR